MLFMKSALSSLFILLLLSTIACFVVPDEAVPAYDHSGIHHSSTPSNNIKAQQVIHYSTTTDLKTERWNSSQDSDAFEGGEISSRVEKPLPAVTLDDGSEDYSEQSQSSSPSPYLHLRSEDQFEPVIYIDNSETEYVIIESNRPNYFQIFLALLIVSKLIFVAWVVGRALRRRRMMQFESYGSPQRYPLREYNIQQLEHQIRYHQNQSQKLREYFIRVQQQPQHARFHQQGGQIYGRPILYESSHSDRSQMSRQSGGMQVQSPEVRLKRYEFGRTVQNDLLTKIKEAVHLPTKKKVSIQVMRVSRDAEEQVAMRNYMDIIRRLPVNQNIMRVYEVIESQGKVYVVMEPIQKQLFDHICSKKLGVKEAIAILKQILCAIEALYDAGVAHRDLQPEKIYISEEGTVKILPTRWSAIYRPSQLLWTSFGSPLYASPEFLQGMGYDPVALDIWKCGVIFYCMLKGELPFEDVMQAELSRKVVQEDFRMPEQISEICKVLLKGMLAKNPQQRFRIEHVKKWIELSERFRNNHTYSERVLENVQEPLLESSQNNLRKSNGFSKPNQEIEMRVFRGDYESHYIFRRDPSQLFERLASILDHLQIQYRILSRYSLETSRGLQISLQTFEGLDNAFIIVFSEKSSLNAHILEELQI